MIKNYQVCLYITSKKGEKTRFFRNFENYVGVLEFVVVLPYKLEPDIHPDQNFNINHFSTYTGLNLFKPKIYICLTTINLDYGFDLFMTRRKSEYRDYSG